MAQTFVRTRGELQSLYDLAAPLATRYGVHAVHVGFLSHTPNDALKQGLAIIENDFNHFTFGPREIIWTMHAGMIETSFGRKGMTGKRCLACSCRKVNTLERMLEKWQEV